MPLNEIEKNEELMEKFLREIQNIRFLLGESPIRNIDKKVVLGRVEGSSCPRIGVIDEGDLIIVDKNLSTDEIDAVIKREAFISFLPEVDFPQIYDLALFYSGHLGLWSKCPSRARLRTLPIYRSPEDFLSINPKNALDVIRSVTKSLISLWREGRGITLRKFLELLMAARGYPYIHMSKKEERVLSSIVYALAHEGEAKIERLSIKSGLSLATVSRAVRELVNKGVIVGPYVLYLSRLGLATYLMELRNPKDEEIRFLDEFPFTYSAFITSSDTYYVNLLIPHQIEPIFKNLRGSGIRFGKRVALSFNMLQDPLISPELVLERMMDGYYSAKDTPEEMKELASPRKPPISLDRKDLLALKEIDERGRVSRDQLRSMGLPNPAERFSKYRKAGIVVKGYFPTGLGMGEGIVFRINAPFKDFSRLRGAFSRVCSVILSFTEGDLNGVTGVALVNGEIIGPLMRAAKILFRERLELMEPAIAAGPSSWQVPVDLWNDEKQEFEFDIRSFMEVFSDRIKGS